MASDTAQGSCPLPQRHRKLTPGEHMDQRKDGESCWAVTWQRCWSSTSGAQAQAARAVTQPILPAADPWQSVPTTHVYRPHLTAPQPHKQDGGPNSSPSQSSNLPKPGPQGPDPHNHPWLLWTLRCPQDSQPSEDPGTGPPAGQTSNLGHQVPPKPRQG